MDASGEPRNFLQDHSLTFLEMAFRHDRRERLAHVDGYAKKTGDCGDTVEFFMNLKGGVIQTLAYDINGCLNTNACCNAVISLAEGKTVESAWDITPEQLADYLETLPMDHFHCAELVVGTLYLTLSDAVSGQRTPWKKMYR